MNSQPQKIVFVTGKGGVGKSLIAAAIARQNAAAGRRVLLAELGDNSYYKDFWGLKEVTQEGRAVPGESFEVALWSGESSLRQYVLHYLKIERLYRLFFENKVMRSLINVAPGLSEISVLGKITSGVRHVGPSLRYDLIVVDAFATGHAMAMFRAPKGMSEAIRFGPMGHQSRDILAVLQNSELCRYVIVTLLEELPIVESLEFRDWLRHEFQVQAEVVANKVVTMPASRDELERLSGDPVGDVGEVAKYLKSVEDRQRRFRGRLESAGVHAIEIPMVYSERPDILVREAAAALALEGDRK